MTDELESALDRGKPVATATAQINRMFLAFSPRQRNQLRTGFIVNSL